MRNASVAAIISVVLAGCSEAEADLSGFKPVDISTWKVLEASSAMALVEPVFGGHPESLEGRPTLKVDLRSLSRSTLAIDVETGGLLDDSIAAERHRAIVERVDGKWRLKTLGMQWKCRRNLINSWGTSLCS